MPVVVISSNIKVVSEKVALAHIPVLSSVPLNFAKFDVMETSNENVGCAISPLMLYSNDRHFSAWFGDNNYAINQILNDAWNESFTDRMGKVQVETFEGNEIWVNLSELENLTCSKWDGLSATPYMITYLCEKIGIPFRAYDQHGMIITETRNMRVNIGNKWKTPRLSATFTAGHCYYTTNKTNNFDECSDILPCPKLTTLRKFNSGDNVDFVHEMFISLEDVMNKIANEPARATLIIYQGDTLAFLINAYREIGTVINSNTSDTVVKAPNLIVMASPYYEHLMRVCEAHGLKFTPKVNMANISRLEYHELPEILESEIPMNYDYAEYLSSSTAQYAVEIGITCNMPPAIISKMWQDNKLCRGCNIETVDKPESERSAVLFIINPELPVVRDNCYILCSECRKLIGNMPLGQYRAENGYSARVGSHYNERTFKIFQAIKTRAIHQLYTSPESTNWAMTGEKLKTLKGWQGEGLNRMTKRDYNRLYASILGNYTPGADNETTGLIAFNGLHYDFPIFTAFDEFETWEHFGYELKGLTLPTGYYEVEFNGLGLSIESGSVHEIYRPRFVSAPELYFMVNYDSVCDRLLVKGRLLASKTLSPLYERRYINQQMRDHGKAAKLSVNSHNGEFGKSISKRSVKYETDNMGEAFAIYMRNPENSISHGTYDRRAIYSVLDRTTHIMQVNALPIYNQVVGMGNICLYVLMRNMSVSVPRPIALISACVDSATFQYADVADVPADDELFGLPVKFEAVYVLVKHIREPITYPQIPPATEYPLEYGPDHDKILSAIMAQFGDTYRDKVLLDQFLAANFDLTKSFQVNGLGGTGKSELMNRLRLAYESLGKRIKIVTYTNSSASNFKKYGVQAYTINTAFNICPISGSHWLEPKDIPEILFLDECSQPPPHILELVNELRRKYDFQIISSGCWYQIPPVDDERHERSVIVSSRTPENICDVQAVATDMIQRQKSELIADMCYNQTMELTTCLRSDDEIFNLSCDIIKDNKPVVSAWVANHINNHDETRMNIVYDNNTRISINLREAAKVSEGQDVISVRFDERASSGKRHIHNVNICVGMIFVCVKNSRAAGFIKGDRYILNSWQTDKISECRRWLENKPARDALKETATTCFIMQSIDGKFSCITIATFGEILNINYAITAASCQSMTINEPYTIHNFDKMSKSEQYVAISRTTKPEYVRINNAANEFKSLQEQQDRMINLSKPVAGDLPYSFRDHLRETYQTRHEITVNERLKGTMFTEKKQKTIWRGRLPCTSHKSLHTEGDDNSVLSKYPEGVFTLRDEVTNRFYCFPDIDEVDEATNGIQHLHEVLAPEMIQRVVMDLDLSEADYAGAYGQLRGKGINSEIWALDIINYFIKSVDEFLADFPAWSGYNVRNVGTPSETVVFDSSNATKQSYHVYTSIYAANCNVAKKCFMEIRKMTIAKFKRRPDFDQALIPLLEKIIDPQMSRPWGSLRLVGSSKVSDPSRVKCLADFNKYEEYDFEEQIIGWYGPPIFLPPIFISAGDYVPKKREYVTTTTQEHMKGLMDAKYPDLINKWKFRGFTLGADRLVASYCPCCDKTHTSENFHFSLNPPSLGCFGSKQKIAL